MRTKILPILKVLALMLLNIVFIAALGIGIFTYKYPKTAISLINDYLIVEPTQVPIKLNGIAVLGDSQSDEYRADDNRGDNYPTTTLNWVEILAEKRKLNFGEWNTYDEPRRTGYEYNWARTGASAMSMIESGQHIGVAEQVRTGKVNVVIIYIGANDFAPYMTPDGFQAIYNEELTPAQIERKINRVTADIETAIDVIQNSGKAKIVLITIPYWGNHVGLKFSFPLPYKRQLVKNVINETNAKLIKIAEERNILVVDPNEFYSNLPKDDTGKPLIGSIPLDYLPINNNPDNVFLRDGAHIGTAMNGLFANYLINSINPYLSNKIKPLTTGEIIDIAGL